MTIGEQMRRDTVFPPTGDANARYRDEAEPAHRSVVAAELRQDAEKDQPESVHPCQRPQPQANQIGYLRHAGQHNLTRPLTIYDHIIGAAHPDWRRCKRR